MLCPRCCRPSLLPGTCRQIPLDPVVGNVQTFTWLFTPTISEFTLISATPLRMFGNLPLRPLSLKRSRDFPHTSHSGLPPGIGRTIHFQFWHRFDNNHTGRWCNLGNVEKYYYRWTHLAIYDDQIDNPIRRNKGIDRYRTDFSQGFFTAPNSL